MTLKKHATNYIKNHKLRITVAVIGISFIISRIYQQDWAYVLTAVCITIHALIPQNKKRASIEPSIVDDVFKHLKLDGNMLHVKQRALYTADIRRVVIDKIDDKYALIDFPFNVHRKLAMRFPIEQLNDIKCWLAEHLPNAELIR